MQAGTKVYQPSRELTSGAELSAFHRWETLRGEISHRHSASRALVRGMDFETLSRWAHEELEALIKILPDDVRAAAGKVPVSMEENPGSGAFDGELAGDELGLFEGPTADEEADPAEMPRIRLFLANLWDWVEQDEQDFRDEVGTTFLHELGHYLGWDEDEVSERGLE